MNKSTARQLLAMSLTMGTYGLMGASPDRLTVLDIEPRSRERVPGPAIPAIPAAMQKAKAQAFGERGTRSKAERKARREARRSRARNRR